MPVIITAMLIKYPKNTTMKKLLYLACIAVTALAGCSKSSNPPLTPLPTSVTINGTAYPIVLINGQTWTTVNYNGPGGVNYDDSLVNTPADGKLYTVAEAQAINLPAGWHLPTAADYNQMLQSLGGNELGTTGNYSVTQNVAVQLMSTTGWTGTEGNDNIGFNARPVGYYSGPGAQFERAGTDAFFIIDTSPANSTIPLSLDVSLNQTAVNHYSDGTDNRMSVRFVKDN